MNLPEKEKKYGHQIFHETSIDKNFKVGASAQLRFIICSNGT